MAALVSFKRHEALCVLRQTFFWRRASSEHPPATVLFPMPSKTASVPNSVPERDHSLARSSGRRCIQVLQHVASTPVKTWLITVLGDLQGFFDVAFLGADNMCVAQWFRSKIECSRNVCGHSVFGSAGSALHGLCEDYA